VLGGTHAYREEVLEWEKRAGKTIPSEPLTCLLRDKMTQSPYTQKGNLLKKKRVYV